MITYTDKESNQTKQKSSISYSDSMKVKSKNPLESFADYGLGQVKTAANAYGAMREPMANVVDSVAPWKPLTNIPPFKAPFVTPMNPMQTKVGSVDINPKAAGHEASRMIVDQAALAGASKLPKVAEAVGSIVPKTVRAISRPFTARGAEITPKAIQAMRESQLVPYGIDEAETARLTKEYGGSTGKITQRILDALRGKQAQAKQMYSDIRTNLPQDFQAYPEEFVGAIDKAIPDTPEGVLKNKLGQMRERLVRPANNEEVLYGGNGREFYNPISSDDWFNFRDELNKMYGNDPSVNRLLEQVKAGLYKSGEASGMKGLPEAREAYRKAFFDYGDRYMNQYGQLRGTPAEGTLEKVGLGTLDEQKVKELQDLESYLGQPFMDEASKINLLRQFEETNTPKAVESLVHEASGVGKKAAQSDLLSRMGSGGKDVMKDLSNNRIQRLAMMGLGAGGAASGVLGLPFYFLRRVGGNKIVHALGESQ